MTRTIATLIAAAAMLSACESADQAAEREADNADRAVAIVDQWQADQAEAGAPADPVMNQNLRQSMVEQAMQQDCDTDSRISGRVDGQQVDLTLYDADNQPVGHIVGMAQSSAHLDYLYIFAELVDADGNHLDDMRGKVHPDGTLEISSDTDPDADPMYGAWNGSMDGRMDVVGAATRCEI